MKKFVVFAGIVMIVFILGACGANEKGSISPVEQIINNELSLKYGISVQILSVEEKYGTQTFEEGYYHAVVQESGKETTFDAYLGMKSRVLKDDYPKLIYGEYIDERIQDILGKYIQTGQCTYEMIYCTDTGTWKEEGQLKDYLEESDTYVNISMEVNGQSEEAAAEMLYDLAGELKETGFHFSMECLYEDHSFYIIDNRYVSVMSYKEILSKLEYIGQQRCENFNSEKMAE